MGNPSKYNFCIERRRLVSNNKGKAKRVDQPTTLVAGDIQRMDAKELNSFTFIYSYGRI